MRVRPRLAATPLLVLVLAGTAMAQTSTEDLKRMSLEDLLEIPVTTASRMPEPASTVPAAIYVITQEDIQRSGARSIPEALRLAPGVQVARINGGTWAIGIRGFADRLARSILVLIDGRAVYSPLFAGTYWETQDTVLADIDRIEIIRGPGGTLWGANAVNGIINIITKSAKDTQGILATGGGGSEERGFGTVRYGGQRGDVAYRAYVKGVDRGPEFHADGNDFDGWRTGQAGFRTDWTLAGGRGLTVQGDIYDGRLGERPTIAFYTPPFAVSSNLDAPLSGGNVLARLSGPAGPTSDFQLQMYFDHTNREEIPVTERRNTFDLDFQQTIRRWSRHTAIWGAGYRVTSGQIQTVAPTAFIPDDRTDSLYSAFVQDEIVLVRDKVHITAGAKLEHNDYSGFEIQPSVRAMWTPAPPHSFFASITRAVRTPSRVESDYTTTSLVTAGTPPVFVRLLPNLAFVPEKLVAYEAGYRARPAKQVSLTLSTFINQFNDSLSTEIMNPFVETVPPPVRVVVPVDFANGLHGTSYGAEATADVRPTPWWRVTANYSYVSVSMSRNPGSRDGSQESRYENAIPHHQTQIGSSFDVRGGWSFDWLFRHISELTTRPAIPAYSASTIRVGWLAKPGLEFAVAGQDLFGDHHLEWASTPNVEIQRSVYASITWRR